MVRETSSSWVRGTRGVARTTPRSRAAWPSAALLLLLWACGATPEPTPADGPHAKATTAPPSVGDTSRCTKLEFVDSDWYWGFGPTGEWTGDGIVAFVRGPRDPIAPATEWPTFLIIKLLSPGDDRNWGGLGAAKTGTVTYGANAGAEADVTTCLTCPILHTDVSGDNPSRVFYPVSGRLAFDSVDMTTRELTGSVEDLVFREVEKQGMKSYGPWTSSPDCIVVPNAHFDTRRIDGRSCKNGAPCPNLDSQVCAPDTATCVSSQCDAGKEWDGATGTWLETNRACSADRACLLVRDRDDWYYGAHIEHAHTTGVCVAPCRGTTCPSGQVCRRGRLVTGEESDVCQLP